MKKRIACAMVMCFLLAGCSSGNADGDVNVGKTDVGNINVGKTDVGNIDVGDMDENLEAVSNYFKNPHNEQEELVQEADLNGDGNLEKISLTNLGYNGGDGGYALSVTTNENGEEREIPLPKGYSDEILFSTAWNDSGVAVMAGDVCIEQILNKTLEGLYDEAEWEMLQGAQDTKEIINGDVVSGFVILEENDGKKVLVVKNYLSGALGHADCLGYGLSKLHLNEDDTWDVEYEFVLDK